MLYPYAICMGASAEKTSMTPPAKAEYGYIEALFVEISMYEFETDLRAVAQNIP